MTWGVVLYAAIAAAIFLLIEDMRRDVRVQLAADLKPWRATVGIVIAAALWPAVLVAAVVARARRGRMPGMDLLAAVKSRTAMYIYFAVVLVAAAALLAWGILHHTEPGLMPDPPAWRAPIVVCPDGRAEPTDDELGALRYAVHTTNDRLGFEVFRIGAEGGRPPCDATIEFDAAVWSPTSTDPDATACGHEGGLTSFEHIVRDDGSQLETAAQVLVCNPGTAEIRQLVLQHELGHVLGLAHDPDDDTSIMRPVQHETPDGEFPPHITDSDRALLRARFGRR